MPLPARDRKIKKRTGFGSHPGRRNRQTNGGSRQAAIATLSGSSSVASSVGAPIASTEKSKSGQVLVRTQRGQNQISRPFFQGGMSGVLNLGIQLPVSRERDRSPRLAWVSARPDMPANNFCQLVSDCPPSVKPTARITSSAPIFSQAAMSSRI